MSPSRKQATSEATAEWVSLHEASKLLGETREQVLQHGITGTLEVKRFGRWTFVSRKSVDARIAARDAA